jgi:hypothetical protein
VLFTSLRCYLLAFKLARQSFSTTQENLQIKKGLVELLNVRMDVCVIILPYLCMFWKTRSHGSSSSWVEDLSDGGPTTNSLNLK